MEIIIRNITEEDIAEVVDIQIRGWQTAYKGIIDEKFLNSMNKEERIEERKNDYMLGNFIVAEVNGDIVGFCRYYGVVISPDGEDYDCELMALYVKPELKQQGIGKEMFKFVLSDLKNRGKNRMILWCLKDNHPSRKFYEKMGGVLVREHEIKIADKSYVEVGYGYEIL